MRDDRTMAVDDLGDIDVRYIPFMVLYLDNDTDSQHNLLVFSESVKQAATIADGFLSNCGFSFIVLNVALMNVQFTLVQKDEECQSVGTDELDDPIRR